MYIPNSAIDGCKNISISSFFHFKHVYFILLYVCRLPAAFIEKIILCLMYALGIPAKKSVVCIVINFCYLYLVPPTVVLVFVLLPCCFNYYSLVVCFKIRYCDVSSLTTWCSGLLLYSGSFLIPKEF